MAGPEYIVDSIGVYGRNFRRINTVSIGADIGRTSGDAPVAMHCSRTRQILIRLSHSFLVHLERHWVTSHLKRADDSKQTTQYRGSVLQITSHTSNSPFMLLRDLRGVKRNGWLRRRYRFTTDRFCGEYRRERRAHLANNHSIPNTQLSSFRTAMKTNKISATRPASARDHVVRLYLVKIFANNLRKTLSSGSHLLLVRLSSNTLFK